MHTWVGDFDVPIRYVRGAHGLRAVGIEGPHGEIVIR